MESAREFYDKVMRKCPSPPTKDDRTSLSPRPNLAHDVARAHLVNECLQQQYDPDSGYVLFEECMCIR